MFGFPFLTSLVVISAMVVAFSFVINHGIQKKRANDEQEHEANQSTLRNHHA